GKGGLVSGCHATNQPAQLKILGRWFQGGFGRSHLFSPVYLYYADILGTGFGTITSLPASPSTQDPAALASTTGRSRCRCCPQLLTPGRLPSVVSSAS